MDARFGFGVATLSVLFLIVAEAVAAPVTELLERFELDWTEQRVRFYGEARVEAAEGDAALDLAAKRARVNAGVYARAAAATAGGALGDGSKLAAAAISTVTTYYGDGSVRVYLEAPLGEGFSKAEALSVANRKDFSGVILRLSGKVSPTGVYLLIDERGRELYAAGHLGGRWLKRPSEEELTPFVGERAIPLAAEPLGPGRLRIARADWDQNAAKLLPLLNAGAVALVLP